MSKETDTFLSLARHRFKQAETADQAQRTRELEDLRFYAGEQWDDDLLKSRKGQTIGTGTTVQTVPARPSLTINKTREPVRQVLNQERQSDLSVELIPADDFGDMAGPIDHTEIQLREGLVRRIQRDSEATDARTWAFARSAIAGRGYWGVMTRYVPKRADQEVYIHRFYNQSSVVLDPAHQQPDASDIDWAFVAHDLAWARYVAEYGKDSKIAAEPSAEEWRALGDEAPKWFTGEGDTRMVRVTEYWHTKRTSTELYHCSDGSAVPKDRTAILPAGVTLELDDQGKPVTHTDVQKQIKWCKINGVEILDETDWPGHYIPIIKVVGEELQPYDNERRCEGIVRPMQDACKGNNYIISKFVERVGLTPIPPWMMAGGQDEGYELEYDAANTRTVGRLHYNQKDNFGMQAPPPFKPDNRADIADIAMGVQVFGQAIASTSVVPETALGNVDPSVKSGKLAKALIDQAERGTSNFLDNLARSMRHEARIVNDLLYPIYGAREGRLARLMNPQGEMDAVIIGQPFTMQGQGKSLTPVPVQPGQQLPNAKTFKLTPDAEFNVAIKISKSEGTRREREVQTLGEVISADPTLMGVLGDLFFKYQDGPGHEEMSERMTAVLVPPVQALLKKGQSPVPPEVEAQMQQLQAENQQLKQLVETKQAEIQAKGAIDIQKTQIQEQGDTERAILSANASIAVAEVKTASEDLNRRLKLIELFLTAKQEERLDAEARDDAHRAQGREHAHAITKAGIEHQHAMEQAEASGAQQMALNEQQAALTPEPEAGT